MTAIDLTHPFTGHWLVQNSPVDRVPSHGTDAFATSHAIDFVPVTENGRSAPFTLGSLLRPEDPEHFPGFGRPILAPADGTVIAVHDGEVDHPAHRGLPSVRYAATQQQRIAEGWPALAGNHVMIRIHDLVVVLCHLQRGSIEVAPGQGVRVGDLVARCGNSGNSTEPHLHIQAMDGPDPRRAQAVPLTFAGTLPRNGEVVSPAEGPT
jgi:hypothetical protein